MWGCIITAGDMGNSHSDRNQPRREAVRQADGQDEKGGDQVGRRQANVRGMLEPGGGDTHPAQVVDQHHPEDRQAAELVDSLDTSRDAHYILPHQCTPSCPETAASSSATVRPRRG